MKIVDIEGKVIEVENLALALLQAEDYRHYRHSAAGFEEFDDRQQAYWDDVYQKLLALDKTAIPP